MAYSKLQKNVKLINIYQIQINKRQITNNNDNIQHEHRVFNQKKLLLNQNAILLVHLFLSQLYSFEGEIGVLTCLEYKYCMRVSKPF